MKIKQFKFAADNFGYLLYSQHSAIAIDGGAPDKMAGFAKQNGLKVIVVTNTHSHHDHTPGNKTLLDLTGAQFLDCRSIRSDRDIQLDKEVLTVIPSPGHTADSVSFLAPGFMVTGDTLFNGTVGNCFSGDLDAFFASLKRLISLPPDTMIWSGHDYVLESMQVARQIEPDNPDIDAYLSAYNPERVVSTLADELKVNPYIRFNAPKMIRLLQHKNRPADSQIDCFKSIMELF
jgi:hydroxyacylglutathione hydrolase